MAKNKITWQERFNQYVSKTPDENGCILWLACKNSKGYGNFRFNGSMQLSHRISWILNRGYIPSGMGVLHTCDNPPCVNPNHLYLGTTQDNTKDMVKRNRQSRGIVHRLISGSPKTSVNKSKYKGVCWDKNRDMWVARIRKKNSRIHIGHFDDELTAYKAYQEALKIYG